MRLLCFPDASTFGPLLVSDWLQGAGRQFERTKLVDAPCEYARYHRLVVPLTVRRQRHRESLRPSLYVEQRRVDVAVVARSVSLAGEAGIDDFETFGHHRSSGSDDIGT